jgi:hypothetical protein
VTERCRAWSNVSGGAANSDILNEIEGRSGFRAALLFPLDQAVLATQGNRMGTLKLEY